MLNTFNKYIWFYYWFTYPHSLQSYYLKRSIIVKDVVAHLCHIHHNFPILCPQQALLINNRTLSLRILHNPVFQAATTNLYVWLDFLSCMFPVSTGQKRNSWGQTWSSSHFVDDITPTVTHLLTYLSDCSTLPGILCDQSPWLLKDSLITSSQVTRTDTGFHTILQLVPVGSCLILLSFLLCPSTCSVTIGSRTEHKDNTKTHS